MDPEPAGSAAPPAAAPPVPLALPDDALEIMEGGVVDGAIEGSDELPARSVLFDGPHKIAITALQAWVHLYPDDETPYLGYARAGAVIDRSEGWVVKTLRCPDGWYEVLPRGYICNGKRATLDLNDPVVIASHKRPGRGTDLPYAYVRPNGQRTYIYFRLPTEAEQGKTEGKTLASHLAARSAIKQPQIELLGEPEPLPEFLSASKGLPTPFGATKRLRYSAHEGRADMSSAFALLSVHDHEGRLFGLTTELDLLAIDRVHIVKPSLRHGAQVLDLPAGVVQSFDTPRYILDETGRPKKDGKFERFEIVDLTGNMHHDLWETRHGYWIAGGAMKRVEPRTSFPSFAEGAKKWLDISIKDQLLVAYMGKSPVYVAQVSTGLGKMSDPEKSFATIRGAFTIKSKHVTATMTGSRQADAYELADVPYVQYFYKGYALHAAFWHDNFGRVQSHGCVNLTPADAAWIFEWTDPVVPPEWHGANATDDETGTVVYVRY